MKLNHLHLTVEDVPAARRFLESYFGLRPLGDGHKNFDMLLDDDGFALTLIGVGRSNSVSYPKTFHVGFVRPSDADVDEINQRLNEDGFDVEPPSPQRGAWAFSFQAPGNFKIVVRSASPWSDTESRPQGHAGSHRQGAASHGPTRSVGGE